MKICILNYLGGKVVHYTTIDLTTFKQSPSLPFSLFPTIEKENEEYIFDNISADEKAIKLMLFSNGYIGKQIPRNPNSFKSRKDFYTFGNGKDIIGFKFLGNNGNIITFKSLSKLLPRINLEKINPDPIEARIIALRNFYLVENLKGFTLAGAVFSKWKRQKGNMKSVHGWDFNYKRFENNGYVEDVCNAPMCGLNIYHPAKKGKLLHDVIGIDRNSQYPFIAMKYPLPLKAPEKVSFCEYKLQLDSRKNELGYFLVHVYKARIKDGYFPFIPQQDGLKTRFNKIIDDDFIYMWDFEYNEFKIRYESIDEICFVHRFRAKKGIFDDYFGEIFKKKEKATKNNDYLGRYFAKAEMNMLLGSFAKPMFKFQNVETEEGKWETFEGIDEFRYAPLFSYITAMGRIETEMNINDIFKDSFVYSDTDSIYFERPKIDQRKTKELDIDDSRIGAYKIEKRCAEFCFRGQKNYSYITTDGEIENVVASIDFSKNNEPRLPSEFKKGGYYYKEYLDTSEFIPKIKKEKIYC